MINFAIYEFDSNLYDLYPTLPSRFTYTNSDEIGSNGIVTRTLSCEDSELTKLTYIIFGSDTITDREKSLLKVTYLNTSNVTSMNSMFRGCDNLTSLDLSNFNTSKVTNMASMFNGCSNLTSLNVSNFNTSLVTNTSYMFGGCSSLTSLDLSNFDTSLVTNMNYMFSGCNSLTSLDLSGFNTSLVTSMTYMFHGCNSLTSLDLSNFDTSKVTNTSYMFNGCSNLTTIFTLNASVDTINKLILNLTTRSENSNGSLYVSDTIDISSVDVSAANAKYWKIVVVTETVDSNEIKKIYHQNTAVANVKYGPSTNVKHVYMFRLSDK